MLTTSRSLNRNKGASHPLWKKHFYKSPAPASFSRLCGLSLPDRLYGSPLDLLQDSFLHQHCTLCSPDTKRSLSLLLSEQQAGESENAVMYVQPFKNKGQVREAECKQDRSGKWQGQSRTKILVCTRRNGLGATHRALQLQLEHSQLLPMGSVTFKRRGWIRRVKGRKRPREKRRGSGGERKELTTQEVEHEEQTCIKSGSKAEKGV